MLIASTSVQRPPDARLLVIDADGVITDTERTRLTEHLRGGDVVIANDAATIPASLRGVHEPSGGTIEVRLAAWRSGWGTEAREFAAVVFGDGDHRVRTEERPAPPKLRVGDRLALGPLEATIIDVLGHPRLVAIRFMGSSGTIWEGIVRHGRPIQYAHVPEPLATWDVWTRVAAFPVAFEPPSATFVLDWSLLRGLTQRDVAFATVTLAAGISSTGDPLLDEWLPFDEPYRVPESAVRAIDLAKARGGRVVALGTSVTRALEHASAAGGLRAGSGVATQRIGPETHIRVVDAIVTGVHEPGSSHYEVLRAFAPHHVLRRMTSRLDAAGYRMHEFGDSVLVARTAREPGSDSSTSRLIA